MTPEEQLDRLTEQWKRDAALGPVESSERETRLAAALALMQRLQELAVPPAFAVCLEARMLARARSLAAQRSKVILFPRAHAQSGRRQRTRGRLSHHAQVRCP